MEEKKTKKKFRVLYWVHLSDTFEIEAASEEEAKQILKDRIESGDSVNLEAMALGDSGYDVIGEVADV